MAKAQHFHQFRKSPLEIKQMIFNEALNHSGSLKVAVIRQHEDNHKRKDVVGVGFQIFNGERSARRDEVAISAVCVDARNVSKHAKPHSLPLTFKVPGTCSYNRSKSARLHFNGDTDTVFLVDFHRLSMQPSLLQQPSPLSVIKKLAVSCFELRQPSGLIHIIRRKRKALGDALSIFKNTDIVAFVINNYRYQEAGAVERGIIYWNSELERVKRELESSFHLPKVMKIVSENDKDLPIKL